jgi:serine phosphatase RsbU (regulator of sigma subunit)
MNLNKNGKYILLVSAPVFVISLMLMVFSNISEIVGLTLLLGSYLLFCFSFSLIFYNSPIVKRKKASNVIVIICSSIFIIGWAFKFMHWPGAALSIIVSSLLFSFGALPLIMKSRYENRKTLLSEKTLVLSIADMISFVFIINGLLFKVMHWPGGLLLIQAGIVTLVITFIFWNVSFRKEVKLRLVAEEKLKETLNEVEEKQKEITDSINYAKRIQEAILPSREFIKTYLPDSFLYYQPKDIVAGDFYWAEKIGETFYIAAADCTGHGVPGALVSVVCCNALNRSVKEFQETEPGRILDKTRDLVLESFSKSGGDIKDGMDISLLSIKGNEVKWAGANNPLWYIMSSVSSSATLSGVEGQVENKELIEIKADKQPIGKTDNPVPFTTHILNLSSGTTLYLFTDGYADQFGGPRGKKFKYKQFENLLVEYSSKSLDEQSSLISKGLNDWKGALEQVDDICVIGIRL